MCSFMAMPTPFAMYRLSKPLIVKNNKVKLWTPLPVTVYSQCGAAPLDAAGRKLISDPLMWAEVTASSQAQTRTSDYKERGRRQITEKRRLRRREPCLFPDLSNSHGSVPKEQCFSVNSTLSGFCWETRRPTRQPQQYRRPRAHSASKSCWWYWPIWMGHRPTPDTRSGPVGRPECRSPED